MNVTARRGDLPPVAFIDEPNCIGCARCLKVCPTDAIVGALNFMHTVISVDCTGCELCVLECPTDCIQMQPRARENTTRTAVAARWRKRIRARRDRLERELRVQAQARHRLQSTPR